MKPYYSTADDLAAELCKEASAKKEEIMLGQLNELVSRGLLVWEETEPQLVRECDSNTVVLRMAGRLVLKDQEYVEKLETENALLREQLSSIKDALREKV